MKGAAWCQGRLYESQNFRRQPVALEIFGDFMHGRSGSVARSHRSRRRRMDNLGASRNASTAWRNPSTPGYPRSDSKAARSVSWLVSSLWTEVSAGGINTRAAASCHAAHERQDAFDS